MKVRDTVTWFRKSEAAQRLGVDKRTIEHYIADGTLQAYKLHGWLVLLKKEDVDALIEALQHKDT